MIVRLTVAFLAAAFLLSSSLLSQENTNPTKMYEDEGKKRAELEQDILDSTSKLKNSIDALVNILTNTKSPIKVRGGSTTFRVKPANQWQQTGSAFCTDVDTADLSYIALNDVKPLSASPTPLTLSNISVDWRLDFIGHKPLGGDSGEGLSLSTQLGKTCSGNTDHADKSSALLSVLAGSRSSGFYPDNDAVSEEASGQTHLAKRFLDKSPNCTAPAATYQGDEDACERTSKILLTLSPSSASATTYKYKCHNGECSVVIGEP